MPGITGIITKQPKGNELEQVKVMLRCMLHEPFYVTSTYNNPDLGVHIGHVAIENSFSDALPVSSEANEVTFLVLRAAFAIFVPTNINYIIKEFYKCAE